ncbi:unnamed protein product [marine sediment metagenome]|uniref:Uncharacterized protein n=1 Tax=marine sediment metagenome TaxID=412755 RepID=X1LD85_9ZZZZ
MAMPLESLNYFLPIFSFLLVFVIVYALLAKTKFLGENQFVLLLISFILAVFFIIEASLVKFVEFSSAWFAVFLVCVFLILLLIGLTHGKIEVIQRPWLAWVLVGGLIVFFIISSAYTFNWAINISEWFSKDWFGLVLLLVIAGVVSWVIGRK